MGKCVWELNSEFIRKAAVESRKTLALTYGINTAKLTDQLSSFLQAVTAQLHNSLSVVVISISHCSKDWNELTRVKGSNFVIGVDLLNTLLFYFNIVIQKQFSRIVLARYFKRLPSTVWKGDFIKEMWVMPCHMPLWTGHWEGHEGVTWKCCKHAC